MNVYYEGQIVHVVHASINSVLHFFDNAQEQDEMKHSILYSKCWL